jgi:hypothetical protein
MGTQGREMAEKVFSDEVVIRGTLAVYDSLLNEQPPRR